MQQRLLAGISDKKSHNLKNVNPINGQQKSPFLASLVSNAILHFRETGPTGSFSFRFFIRCTGALPHISIHRTFFQPVSIVHSFDFKRIPVWQNWTNRNCVRSTLWWKHLWWIEYGGSKCIPTSAELRWVALSCAPVLNFIANKGCWIVRILGIVLNDEKCEFQLTAARARVCVCSIFSLSNLYNS